MRIETWIENWQKNEGKKMFADMGMTDDSTVIDFGCGVGNYAIAAAEDAGTVYAVDTSSSALRVLDGKHIANIRTVQSNGGIRMPFAKDESVDFVLIFDLIHQLRDQDAFVREAYRVLKKGGTLAVLPFHMSMREKNLLAEEIRKEGFPNVTMMNDAGLHFEMYAYSGRLEKGDIYCFRKKEA